MYHYIHTVKYLDPAMRSKRLTYGVLATLWLLAIAAGFFVLERHRFAAGEGVPSMAAAVAPPDATEEKALLVVSLHPECPCSRASVEELDRALVHAPDNLSVRVLMADHPNLPHPVQESAMWRRVARIPGVILEVDPRGQTARAFGLHTSGEVAYYGADGRLRYSGGITGSRGHEGANPGRAQLEKVLRGVEDETVRTVVYGCGVQDPITRTGAVK